MITSLSVSTQILSLLLCLIGSSLLTISIVWLKTNYLVSYFRLFIFLGVALLGIVCLDFGIRSW